MFFFCCVIHTMCYFLFVLFVSLNKDYREEKCLWTVYSNFLGDLILARILIPSLDMVITVGMLIINSWLLFDYIILIAILKWLPVCFFRSCNKNFNNYPKIFYFHPMQSQTKGQTSRFANLATLAPIFPAAQPCKLWN